MGDDIRLDKIAIELFKMQNKMRSIARDCKDDERMIELYKDLKYITCEVIKEADKVYRLREDLEDMAGRIN